MRKKKKKRVEKYITPRIDQTLLILIQSKPFTNMD